MNLKATSSIKDKIKTLISLQLQKKRPFKPVIISDIDGVLVRGNTPIPQTLQAMEKIHKLKIPFACLTNGGGRTQHVKAQNLNKCFNNRKIFQGKSMFLNHTPLKPELLRFSREKGNLLVSGSLSIMAILEDLGIKNYVTADELYAIYFQDKQHEQDTHLHFHKPTLTKQAAQSQIQKRLNRSIQDFPSQALQINSIFALNDISPYQTTLVVIHNILKEKKKQNKILSYYAAQNDIIWAGGYFKPRIAFGPFNYVLDQHCKRHQLSLIQHIYYGKPQIKAFRFVENEMRKREPNGVFFMMGDNPRADIRGANNIGWYSFLTQTGIHQGQDNDPTDPATFVVSNFHEAVQIITEACQHLPKN